ncbi:nitroreductase [candidate division KSB1 bacterium]|nr:MAG: nitroreductase [candidate division KSB1 bacterium]
MEFFEVLKERHSIRAYKAQDIEEEKINAILNAANSAPSAGNLQAYKIYKVVNREKKSKLVWAAFGQSFIEKAPLCLVFCAHPQRSAQKYGRRGVELYSIQDATIAATFAHLTATALGLGSVFVGAFNEKEVKKALSLPRELKPIIILPVGYIDEIPYSSPRKSLNELVVEID